MGMEPLLSTPRLRVVTALSLLGVCAGVAAIFSYSNSSQPHPLSLVSNAAVEAGDVSAVEQKHDILVQKSKLLASKIGALANTLKQQEESLTGEGKVPQTDLTQIQNDVETITTQWQEYKAAEKIPDLKRKPGEHDDAYTKKLKMQEQQLRSKARDAFLKSQRESEKAADLKNAEKDDDAHYKAALAAEKKTLAKLQAEKKRRMENLEQRNEIAKQRRIEKNDDLQRQEQLQIKKAETQVKQDAKRRAAEHAEEKANLRSWGMAAQAAARGDAKAVGEFCQRQKQPAACRDSLLSPSTSAGSGTGNDRRPCNPSSSGYLRCLGVRATGATLAGPSSASSRGVHMGDADIARLVANTGHELMLDKTRVLRRIRNHHLHNKNWMAA